MATRAADSDEPPRVIVFAGPNGAGKSTHAEPILQALGTTLSSRSFARLLAKLRAQGYRVSLFYFALRRADLAVRRVKMRVQMGGHSIPADVIRRRFGRSLHNLFTLYLPNAHEWTVFDNSGPLPVRLATQGPLGQIDVLEYETWQKLQQLAQPARTGH